MRSNNYSKMSEIKIYILIAACPHIVNTFFSLSMSKNFTRKANKTIQNAIFRQVKEESYMCEMIEIYCPNMPYD